MAYAAVITVTSLGAGNFQLQIDETEARTASETAILLSTYGLPVQGSVFLQACTLTAGSGMPGATIDPILTTVSGSILGTQVVAENATPLVNVDNEALRAIPYYTAGGSLFHRANVSDNTPDHTISTIYMIRRGWT